MSNNSERTAYPIFDNYGNTENDRKGLTKREYFAGIVVQGLLANKPPYIDNSNYGEGERVTKENIKKFIEHGLRITDELLKQLETK